MPSALIILFLAITFATIQSLPFDQLAQKYYENIPSDLYVSIGYNQSLNEAFFYWLRNWKALFVLQDQHQIQMLSFRPEKTTIILSKFPEKPQEIVKENSLGKICNRYYSKAPKILVLNNKFDQVKVLESNFWNNSVCLPSILLVKDSPQQFGTGNYLRQIGYSKQGNRLDMIEYFRSEIESSIIRYHSFEEAVHSKSDLKSMLEIIESRHAKRTTVYAHFMADQTLLVDNLQDSIETAYPESDVFIANYRIASDSIIVAAQYYQIQLSIIREIQFYKINVGFPSKSFNLFLYIAQSDRSLKLRVIDLKGEKSYYLQNGTVSSQIISKCPQAQTRTEQVGQIETSKESLQQEVQPVDQHTPIEDKPQPIENQSQLIEDEPIIDEASSIPEDNGDAKDSVIYALVGICIALIYYIVIGRSKPEERNQIRYEEISKQYIEAIDDDHDSNKSSD